MKVGFAFSEAEVAPGHSFAFSRDAENEA